MTLQTAPEAESSLAANHPKPLICRYNLASFLDRLVRDDLNRISDHQPGQEARRTDEVMIGYPTDSEK